MNDAKRAAKIIGPILRLVEGAMDELGEIVGRDQNQPPEGLADGSFSESAWLRLRDMTEHLRQFMERARK